MTLEISWPSCFRIIAAHLPRIDIFEQVADAGDLAAVLKIEALTNPRLLELQDALRTVDVADRITGPGATFVMAPFAYPRASRFTDGTLAYTTPPKRSKRRSTSTSTIEMPSLRTPPSHPVCSTIA